MVVAVCVDAVQQAALVLTSCMIPLSLSQVVLKLCAAGAKEPLLYGMAAQAVQRNASAFQVCFPAPQRISCLPRHVEKVG